MSAASKAKRRNPDLEVLAFERTPHVSYSACGIPYYVADLVREASELVTITPEQFREQRGIEVFTRHEAVRVSPIKRKVVVVNLDTGRERAFDYDRLLIAVGGKPRRPEIPGADLPNVFTVQTLQDGMRIRRFVDEQRPRRAVIVGGGYIGMEMAEAFRRRDLETTVVEKTNQILPGFERTVVEQVESELDSHQVRRLTGCEVNEIRQPDETTEPELAVTLSNGETVPAELVLFCTGLTPNVHLAVEAGVHLGVTGAIAVNRKLQTNVANVYAAGDCVQVKNLVSGEADYVPLGPTANKQGRVAGENVAGGTAAFPGVVGTSVFKVFELEVARTGLTLERARTAGFDAESVTITAPSKAGYYPGAEPLTVAVIFDRRSGRLLGAQMVGREGVSKRIDAFAVALMNRLTLDEAAYLDLSYAPPFAPVWDPVLVAIHAARGKLGR